VWVALGNKPTSSSLKDALRAKMRANENDVKHVIADQCGALNVISNIECYVFKQNDKFI